MINLAIVGLYNRGQQDEYVEMEAASSCSLSRFVLIRRVENEEGYYDYSQIRLYEFPDTNVRKGNRIRLYTGFRKAKKERLPDGVTYNFSWNLDTPIWVGSRSYPELMELGDSTAFIPDDPIGDVQPTHERGTLEPITDQSFRQAFGKAIVEGRMNVHDEHLRFVPVEIVGAPAEAQPFLDNGDFEGLMNYLRQQGSSQKTGKTSQTKK